MDHRCVDVASAIIIAFSAFAIVRCPPVDAIANDFRRSNILGEQYYDTP